VSVSRSSVFDKFLFFGMLIPGLFESVLVLPYLPGSLLAGSASTIVLYVVVFSFVLGVLLNIFADPLVSRYLTTPRKALDTILTDGDTDLYHRSAIDERLVANCLEEFRRRGLLSEDETDPESAETPDLSDEDVLTLYRYMLTQVWKSGETPAKILHSLLNLGRSLIFLCLLQLVGLVSFTAWRVWSGGSYAPFYSTYVGDITFFVAKLCLLVLLLVGSVHIHRQYSFYFCVYLLADFEYEAGHERLQDAADHAEQAATLVEDEGEAVAAADGGATVAATVERIEDLRADLGRRPLSDAEAHRQRAVETEDATERIDALEDAVACYRNAASLVAAPDSPFEGDEATAREDAIAVIEDLLEARTEAAEKQRAAAEWEADANHPKSAYELYVEAREHLERAIELAEDYPPGDPEELQATLEDVESAMDPLEIRVQLEAQNEAQAEAGDEGTNGNGLP
jgi:hypothetical protein